MDYQHKDLALGAWCELSFFEQMANVGSEVERSIKWKNKGNDDYFRLAFDRTLELFDLTVSDLKNLKRLKEIMRVREALVDCFYYDNDYKSSDKLWQNYFYAFNYAARLGR